MILLICKRNDIKEHIKQKDPQTQRLNLLGDGGGIYWEFGVDRYTVLYLKWITKKRKINKMDNQQRPTV